MKARSTRARLPPRRTRHARHASRDHQAVSMTSYRQMRRQARHVRRVGLQPIMVINNDGQFPAPAGVILARWAWRYRSELAPVVTAATVFGASLWTHHAHPQ